MDNICDHLWYLICIKKTEQNNVYLPKKIANNLVVNITQFTKIICKYIMKWRNVTSQQEQILLKP